MSTHPKHPNQPIDLPSPWRQDFPVDESQSNLIGRREFTKFLVLISGAFAAGHFWIGLLNLWQQKGGLPLVKEIIRVGDLAVGEFKAFYYPTLKDRCLLIHTEARNYVAYSDQCTHLMCPVVPDVAEGKLVCPCHNGAFSIRDGSPLYGPPRRPLARVRLVITERVVYAAGMMEA